MAPGGAPSSGCLLWDSGHFGELTNSKNFLSCTLLPLRGAPRPARCRPYTAACSAPPVARHLSGEARRSRNRGPAASLARRGSPGPLSMRKRAYIERAAIRRAGEGTAGRDASAKPHGRRPYYCNARPFNSCTAETLSNGLLRLCRVVLLITSYCRSILLQHKPSVVLSDLVFCRQRDKCAQLVNHQPLLHHLLL